jgi:hypothetical protein
MVLLDEAFYLIIAVMLVRRALITILTTTTLFLGKSSINAVRTKVSISALLPKVGISRLGTCCSFEVAGRRHMIVVLMRHEQRPHSDMDREKMGRMVKGMQVLARNRKFSTGFMTAISPRSLAMHPLSKHGQLMKVHLLNQLTDEGT